MNTKKILLLLSTVGVGTVTANTSKKTRTDALGRSAAHRAIVSGDNVALKNIIQIYKQKHPIKSFFIGARSILNTTDVNNHTPLHYAVNNRNSTAVAILIAEKVELGSTTVTGKTALNFAVLHRSFPIAEQLVRAGAMDGYSVTLAEGIGCRGNDYKKFTALIASGKKGTFKVHTKP